MIRRAKIGEQEDVEGDDHRGEQSRRSRVSQRGLTSDPITSRSRAMSSSGTSAKGMPKESTTWLQDQGVGRVEPDRQDQQRRREGDRAAQEDRDAAADEALHHDLAGHRPDRGGGEAGGQQRDPEDRRGPARRRAS